MAISSTTPLAGEAARYLEAIDILRSLGHHVRWRTEADELGRLSPPRQIPEQRTCNCCGGPLVRINGRHVCLWS